MQTGSYFFIGKTHEICQDYATNNINSVIVCDGCSGSPNTDFGSRILSNLFIQSNLDFNFLKYSNSDLISIICKANDISSWLGMPNNCLDSTVLYAQANDEYINVLVIGDGTIAIIDENDKKSIIDISFPSGAPRYLNYINNDQRNNQYIKEFGEARIIKENILGEQEAISTNTNYFYVTSVPKKGNKAILLMTDGIHAFQRMIVSNTCRTTEPIAYQEVLSKMLDFKGFGGRFIERRMRWFQNKEMSKWNWENLDDLSMGGIFI